MDKKFDILSHPNIKSTEDGGALPYRHSKNDKLLSEDIHFSNIETIEFIEQKEESEHEDDSKKTEKGYFGRRRKKD